MRTITTSPAELLELERVTFEILKNVRKAYRAFGSKPELVVEIKLHDLRDGKFGFGLAVGSEPENFFDGWPIERYTKVFDGMRPRDFANLLAFKVANLAPGWTTPNAELALVVQHKNTHSVTLCFNQNTND